jgi:hypothetical protein
MNQPLLRAETVLRIDAIFEMLLAAYLVVCVIGWPEGVRMADPASDALILVVAGVLALAGVAIWMLAMRPDRLSVLGLAIANDAGAAIFLAWLAMGDGFSPAAAGLLLAVSAALMALAVAEMIALPRPEPVAAAR